MHTIRHIYYFMHSPYSCKFR